MLNRQAAKRHLAALLFAAFSAASWAQCRLYVLIQGQRAGQAVASHKIMPDGSKLVQLSMQIAGPGGNTVTLRSESTYSAKGSPLRMFHESLTTNPRTRRTVTVTFSARGATAVEEVGGKRTTKEVPLVPGAPYESKSEFWFLRDTPKVGAVDKRYRFNVSSLTWELTSTTYVGPKTYKLGAKNVLGHEIQSTQGLAIVDAKGLPYRLELGQIRLERVPGS